MFSAVVQRLSALQLGLPGVASACTMGGVMTALFMTYYLRRIAVRPRLVGPERIQTFLARHVPIVHEKFWPTWWAFHAILSTLGRVLIQRTRETRYRREILPLQDGGQVGLDWNENPDDRSKLKDDVPIVIILPGITGDSSDQYVRNAAALASSKGYRAVVFNNRGMGGVQVTTPRAYCAANCDDLCEVVLHVQRLHPKSPLFVLGFSMGGMISTHFFGHYCRQHAESKATRSPSEPPQCLAECNVVGGMGVSVCWNPVVACESLESTVLNRALNRRICGNLHRLVRRSSRTDAYQELLDKLGGLERVCQTEFISDFDRCCTVPAFGFKSLDHYYTVASPIRQLADIDIPVLYINAYDDMFMPGKALPMEETAASKGASMIVTKWGGHLGFMEGTVPRGDSYAERLYSQFLTAVFSHGQELGTTNM